MTQQGKTVMPLNFEILNTDAKHCVATIPKR